MPVKISMNLFICISNNALLAIKAATVYYIHAMIFGTLGIVNVTSIYLTGFTISTDNKNQNIDV